jgi:hypothetical protein
MRGAPPRKLGKAQCQSPDCSRHVVGIVLLTVAPQYSSALTKTSCTVLGRSYVRRKASKARSRGRFGGGILRKASSPSSPRNAAWRRKVRGHVHLAQADVPAFTLLVSVFEHIQGSARRRGSAFRPAPAPRPADRRGKQQVLRRFRKVQPKKGSLKISVSRSVSL